MILLQKSIARFAPYKNVINLLTKERLRNCNLKFKEEPKPL